MEKESIDALAVQDGQMSARSARSLNINGNIHHMVPMPSARSSQGQYEGGSDAVKRTVTLTTKGIINETIKKTKDGRYELGLGIQTIKTGPVESLPCGQCGNFVSTVPC